LPIENLSSAHVEEIIESFRHRSTHIETFRIALIQAILEVVSGQRHRSSIDNLVYAFYTVFNAPRASHESMTYVSTRSTLQSRDQEA
jgi:hypothetical protein